MIKHVPGEVNDITPVEEFTVHPVAPAEPTEYETPPSPSDVAGTSGVNEPAVTATDVFDGAHDTVWAYRTVMTQDSVSPFCATTVIVTGLE